MLESIELAAVRQIVSPASTEAWNEVLAADPGATPQQTPEYAAAVRNASGAQDASRLYVLEDGRRLLLPLVRRTPLPRLRFDSGFPAGYGHGGLLAEGGLRPADVATVVEDLRRGHGLSTAIDGHHHTADRWSINGLDALPGVVAMQRRVDVVDLAAGFDELWRRCSASVRRNFAKAERAGVQMECDTSGRLVPVFYEIYLAWVEARLPNSPVPAPVARRLARQREPLKKIENVAALLGDKCRIWVAWHQNQPVASSITLVHGQHAVGWRNYSIKDLAAPVRANTFMHISQFKDALASGCRYFDMGQSSDVPGLLEYKRSLGGVPRLVTDIRVEPPAVTWLRALKHRAEGSLVEVLQRRSAAPGRARPK
jgi:Acetyltransferase (GNAT) domain